MDPKALVPIGIALGICYAVQKFAPQQWVKGAAVGVAGVVVAKQIPYLRNALA